MGSQIQVSLLFPFAKRILLSKRARKDEKGKLKRKHKCPKQSCDRTAKLQSFLRTFCLEFYFHSNSYRKLCRLSEDVNAKVQTLISKLLSFDRDFHHLRDWFENYTSHSDTCWVKTCSQALKATSYGCFLRLVLSTIHL